MVGKWIARNLSHQHAAIAHDDIRHGTWNMMRTQQNPEGSSIFEVESTFHPVGPGFMVLGATLELR
eukprot:scaffold2011_cov142-Skeletonema_menzelii.AAC.12